MSIRGAVKQILIVDHDIVCVEPLRHVLAELGFAVGAVTDGLAAVQALSNRPPDLVILDWETPGLAAFEIIEGVSRSGRTRLILLSSRAGEQDVVAGLNLGADDYIVKPFSLREITARVRSLLRLQRMKAKGTVLSCGDLVLDAASNRLIGHGRPVTLRGIRYRLLEFMMAHPGRTFDRAQLMVQACGADGRIDERTVDVNVQRLRRVLAHLGCDSYIQTVRGFGYRFVPPRLTQERVDGASTWHD